MKSTLTEFFKIVLQQSKLALSLNEIPVAALIFNPINNKIIAFDHNRELSQNDPTAHAEILVIRKSCNILMKKRLDGLSMVTNLQPCNLCLEAIKASRIKEVHYIFTNDNPNKKNIERPLLLQHDIKTDNLIKIFFKTKRLFNKTNI